MIQTRSSSSRRSCAPSHFATPAPARSSSPRRRRLARPRRDCVVKSPDRPSAAGTPCDRRLVKRPQPVVEQGDRRGSCRPSAPGRDRDRCRCRVRQCRVCALAPPRSASAPGQGTSAIDSPVSTTAAIRRRRRGPGLDRCGRGVRRRLTVVAIDASSPGPRRRLPCPGERLAPHARPRSSSRRTDQGRRPGRDRASAQRARRPARPIGFNTDEMSSNFLPPMLRSSRFSPTPVEKRSICRSASKSAAATPMLARSLASPNAADPSSNRPSPLLSRSTSRTPFGPATADAR